MLLLLVFVGALFRFMFFETYVHTGIGMLPEYGSGARIVVNRVSQGFRIPPFRALRILPLGRPENGDRVVFYNPCMDTPSGLRILIDYLTFGLLADSGADLLFRRVVGVSGDLVRVDRQGRLYRNGKIVTGTLGRNILLEGTGNQVRLNGRVVYVSAGLGDFGKMSCRLASEEDYTVIAAAGTNALPAFPGRIGSSSVGLRTFTHNFVARNRDFRGGMRVVAVSGRSAAAVEGELHLLPDPEGGVGFRRGKGRIRPLVVMKRGTAWLRVPEGYYFVLADNRVLSADSRTWGFVSADRVEGLSMFRISD